MSDNKIEQQIIKVPKKNTQNLNNTDVKEKISEFFEGITKNNNFILPFFVIGCLVIFISYQIYGAINESEPLDNLSKYVYLLVVPMVLIFCFVFYITFDINSRFKFLYISIFIISCLIIFYVSLQISSYNFNLTLQNLFYYTFIGFMLMIALTVIFNIFDTELRSKDTWSAFWIEFIFYIPCVFDNLIKYLTNDYLNTSTRTFVLFLVEIGLIIIYFYLFPMYQKSIYDNGIVVLGHSSFLDNSISGLIHPIQTSGANKIEPPIVQSIINNILLQPETNDYGFRNNYAISMWIYINPMPLSRLGYSTETNIFCYGTGGVNNNIINQESNQKQNFHPRLSMSNVNNNFLFNFYYSGETPTHQLELPLQKWNNIVFNYVNSGVDVFINGELSLSHTFDKGDIPVYDDNDDISIGDNNGITKIKANGLYGSICNIVYYKSPLTKREIVLNYNILSVNNPPIL